MLNVVCQCTNTTLTIVSGACDEWYYHSHVYVPRSDLIVIIIIVRLRQVVGICIFCVKQPWGWLWYDICSTAYNGGWAGRNML